MAFKSPEALLLGAFLLGVAALVAYLLGEAGRRRLLQALDPAFAPRPKPLPLPYLLAPLLLLLAAGRPEAPVPWRENLTQAVVVLDTSHSMAADDEAPSRLEKAKALVRAFLKGLDPSVKVGLVSFGPQAVLVLAPSTDRKALLEALAGLKPGGVSPLGQGLQQARRILRPEGPERDLPEARPPAAILLLSDGAANAGKDPLEAAAELAQARLPVFVRPLGDPRGAVSRIGEGLYFVPTDPGTLLRLAQATGGGVLQEDFRPLYQALKPHYVWKASPKELTQALVVGGFLLLSLGAYAGLAREGRWP
ncbi:MAG: VWA domain-containing protein [Thermus sp.]|uniref:vWA domain-containing protein n=1 Tax=Thermus sp. TaxID=275 RepID=UPI00351B4B8F